MQSSCDLCNRYSGLLLDFYGKWACQECLTAHYEQGYEDGYYFYEPPCEPTRTKVSIDEIFCDMDDLGFNLNVKVFTPDWSVKRPIGPLDIEVEFLDEDDYSSSS